MSGIVRLNRVFRPRLEVEHLQSTSSDKWVFAFEHIGEHGRRFVGTYRDVALAFGVAMAWRNQGVRTACVERRQP
jgi:hypothetical protein